MENGSQTMHMYANGYMYACIHSNMREEQHETSVKYRIIIESDNEHRHLEWWTLIDAYMVLLEKTQPLTFDNEEWTIRTEVAEE